VLSIAASGALSFNYPRDRLGGMAVVFYAIASYYALREAGGLIGHAGRARVAAAAIPLVVLTLGWQLRAIGTVDALNERALSNFRGWIATRQMERARHATEPEWLRILNALEAQGTRPPRQRTTADGVWVELLGTR
jgi:hypothetical protein